MAAPVDVIALMERLSAAEEIMLCDDYQGNGTLLTQNEIDMLLHALAEHARRTETQGKDESK